jgi:hypothetical protein
MKTSYFKKIMLTKKLVQTLKKHKKYTFVEIIV